MKKYLITLLSGKTLTAVYLPFRQGSDPVPTYHDGAWHFSTIRYAYYMRAEKVPYTTTSSVDATKVSATINMESPDGYVQYRRCSNGPHPRQPLYLPPVVAYPAT